MLSAVVILCVLPQTALAHQLSGRYEAPLPLAAYLLAAAFAVAVSFLFVMLRRAPVAESAVDEAPRKGRVRHVPAAIRYFLNGVGLLAWLWIVAQTLFGGDGDGDVGTIFVWVYGWVGLAIISALFGPLWTWLNPFATIHRILAGLWRRAGMAGVRPAEYPARLGRWPAIVGFLVVVWLELVLRISGGRPLGLIMIGYTFVSVAGMAYFGRRTWLDRAEVFSVWFELLGRMAPYAVDGDGDDRLARRSFASGLLVAPWTLDELVLVALGTGSIIYDGLTQSQLYFDLFVIQSPLGTDVFVRDSITAAVFLGTITLALLGVARLLTVRAVAGGMLPVAVGYLIAHYLTYLLVDGQHILVALNDPLQHGDNLLSANLATWEPSLFLPTSVVWTIQLGAVIGGHIVGAWTGHSLLLQDGAITAANGRVPILRQLPLAILMVCLTALTLWSLGQAVIVTAPAGG